MNIKFSPPDISQKEIDEVIDTLKSGWITTGPKTKEFERQIAEYCGVNKAVCLNSATAGLELTLKILGIGHGDEVITSAYTYTASASVIEHVGAKIVLCDISKNSYEMDYDSLKHLINEKTKAIIPVDIAGKICDYTKIYEIVEENKNLFNSNNEIQSAIGRIVLIADAAHSFGSIKKEKRSGTWADFTAFSFHAVKNITTAEGGAVVWRNDIGLDDSQIYRQFMLWSLHGQSKDALSKTQIGTWEYDIIMCGQKCNMTDIMASIGIAQLSRIDTIMEKRKEIINYYNSKIRKYADVLEHFGDEFSSCGHLYLTNAYNIKNEKQRNFAIVELAKQGIPTNVHYKPLPMFTAYKQFRMENYPNAFSRYENEITLPLHTLLSFEEIEYIIKNYIEIITNL